MSNLPIHAGGLMRCCIQAITEYTGPELDGTILRCKFCPDQMIVRKGAWEWKRE